MAIWTWQTTWQEKSNMTDVLRNMATCTPSALVAMWGRNVVTMLMHAWNMAQQDQMGIITSVWPQ